MIESAWMGHCGHAGRADADGVTVTEGSQVRGVEEIVVLNVILDEWRRVKQLSLVQPLAAARGRRRRTPNPEVHAHTRTPGLEISPLQQSVLMTHLSAADKFVCAVAA